jgi:hypothetical protein
MNGTCAATPQVIDCWEPVTESDVQTPLEVYAELSEDGYAVVGCISHNPASSCSLCSCWQPVLVPASLLTCSCVMPAILHVAARAAAAAVDCHHQPAVLLAITEQASGEDGCG